MTKELNERIVACAQAWQVAIERTAATLTSVIVYGSRRGRPVVLKVVKEIGDEWRCGEVAALFGSRGMADVYAHVPGAALFERLEPGEPLSKLCREGRDDEVTVILAELLRRMAPSDPPSWCPTVEQWGEAFARYLASGDTRVPRELVEPAQRLFNDLCSTQRNPVLLHGDLHHYNVLSAGIRGWCAIDPKGVVGELEYELGAVLRNPVEQPELFASLDVAERRLETFRNELGIDVDRARAWAFAQAVLSAVWSAEDGDPTGAVQLNLARTLLGVRALRELLA